TVAGDGSSWYPYDDGSPATAQELDLDDGPPLLDAAGNLLVVDTFNGVLRRIDPAAGTMSIFGGFAGPDLAHYVHRPNHLALAPDGSLLVRAEAAHLYRIAADGVT